MTHRIIKSKRIGVIYINLNEINKNPEIVKQIMAKIIVLKADFEIWHERFRYEAISDCFDEMENGSIAPKYDVIIHVDQAKDICEVELRRSGYQVAPPGGKLEV